MALTRDSVVWWVGMVGAVLVAVLSTADALPAACEPARPYLTLLSVIVAAVSGKMATSPLQGESK